MAILNQKKILNLVPKVSAPVTIHVSQGDVGTIIEFTLVKGDEVFSDTGNLSASVHGVREDGANFGPFTCTLSGSKVTFPLHSEMTAVKGSAVAEIVLVDDGGNKVGSANFGILVEQSVFPLGVTYDNDVSVYESILAYVQTIPAQVEADITAAVAQEASIRSSQIQILTSDLSTERSTRANTDSNLQAQIDQIIAPSGEAPSEAEVENARVGADNITYPTLGDAIRANDAQLINSDKENYKNDHKITAEDILYQHEMLQLDDFDFGYISSSTGEPSSDKNRYYYTRDLVSGVIVHNTDTAHYRIGVASYDAQGNFNAFSPNVSTEVFYPNANYKYRYFAYCIDSGGDAYTDHTEIEALTAFSKVLFVKPEASKLIDKTFGGIQKLFNAIDSSQTLPIYAGLKWEYGTINSNGSITYTQKRLMSDKIKCGPMTKITYDGDVLEGYVVHLAQYNGDTFIRRDQLYYNNSNTPIITGPSCTHIRYCFGYTSADSFAIFFDHIKHFSVAAEKVNNVVPVVDSSVTWQQKNLTTEGVISNNTTRILSELIPCTGNVLIAFTGAIENANHIPFFACVGQYDNEGNFISRKNLYFNEKYTDVVTDDDCFYVRFLFGHSASYEEDTEISEASDFSISTTAAGFNAVRTFSQSFGFSVNSQKELPSILTVRSKYTGNRPKISFNTSLYQSPVYSIGGTEYITQSFRIPPTLADNEINFAIDIEDGSTLTIESWDITAEPSATTSRSDDCVFNSHLGFKQMCPECTRAAVDMAGRLGYKSCIVVPKLTADGVVVCIHDDTINRTARNADGTTISETLNVSDLTYQELLAYDFGVFKNAYWQGEKILLFEDYLKICKMYGMTPTLSIHPVFSVEKYSEMKAMLKKYGLLRKLHVKFWGAPGNIFTAFGNDIDEYTFIDSEISAINSYVSTLGITTKVSFETATRSWYTEEHIASYVEADIPVILTISRSDNTTGDDLMRFFSYGCTEVTDDTFCNNGLMWQ